MYHLMESSATMSDRYRTNGLLWEGAYIIDVR